jgi:hypothetical protein
MTAIGPGIARIIAVAPRNIHAKSHASAKARMDYFTSARHKRDKSQAECNTHIP